MIAILKNRRHKAFSQKSAKKYFVLSLFKNLAPLFFKEMRLAVTIWRKYLEKNIKMTTRARNGLSGVKCQRKGRDPQGNSAGFFPRKTETRKLIYASEIKIMKRRGLMYIKASYGGNRLKRIIS